MPAIRNLIFTILVVISFRLLGQSGFVFEYEGTSKMQGKDLIETQDNNIIVLAIVPDYEGNSSIIKLSHDGVVMAEMPIGRNDTVPIMTRIHKLDDSNLYIATGFVETFENEEKYNAYQIHFNSELQIIGESFTQFPKNLEVLTTAIDNEYNLIWAGSYRLNNKWDIAIAKTDLEGGLLHFTTQIRPGNHYVNDVFQLNNEPPIYGLAVSGPVEGYTQGLEFFVQFSADLEHLQTTIVPHIIGVGNTNMAHVHNEMIAFAGKGFRSELIMNNFTTIDKDYHEKTVSEGDLSPLNQSVMVVSDNELNPEYHLVFGDGHIRDFPAPYRAISLSGDNFIYTAGIKNIIPFEWPFQDEPSWIRVNKLDAELNIIWEKHFGGDAYYQVNSATATADGGVVLSGFKTYPGQAPLMNLLVIKLKPDGTVALDEHPAGESLAEVSIFPNPASTQTWLQLPENKPLPPMQIELYSPTGRLLYKAQPQDYFHKIEVAHLPKGLYLVRLWDGESWVTEKLVVR